MVTRIQTGRARQKEQSTQTSAILLSNTGSKWDSTSLHLNSCWDEQYVKGVILSLGGLILKQLNDYGHVGWLYYTDILCWWSYFQFKKCNQVAKFDSIFSKVYGISLDNQFPVSIIYDN